MTVHLYLNTGDRKYWVRVGSGGGQDMGGIHAVEMLGINVGKHQVSKRKERRAWAMHVEEVLID